MAHDLPAQTHGFGNLLIVLSAAARSTIRDRSTSRASRVRLRENRSRSSRCSALNDTLDARRRTDRKSFSHNYGPERNSAGWHT